MSRLSPTRSRPSPQRRLLLANMGGKSTYTTTALGALLAYIGGYVSGAKREIGPIGRIFTRVGAADDAPGVRPLWWR